MNKKIPLTIVVIILFVCIPLWIWIIAPQMAKLPKDFSYRVDVVSLDNFYDEAKQEFLGRTASITNFFYKTESAENGILNVKNIFDVRRSTGEKIFAVERMYGIDQKTGQHVSGHGDRDRTGYLFAPRWLKKGQPYVYWHINYDEPATMVYQATEKLFGLAVYRYEANYHADQTKNLGFLPGVPLTRGINLDIKLITWIEPVTGRLIKYEDYTTAYYYDQKTKERLHPWNQFHNTYTEASVKNQVGIARDEKLKAYLVGRVIPFVLALLTAVLLLLAYRGRKIIKKSGDETKNKFTVPPVITTLAVFVFAMSITLLLWWFALQNVNRKNTEKFSQDVQKVTQAITDRLTIYRNILQGASGLFATSESVTREGWQRYISALNIRQNYAGVQGISFAPSVSSANKTSHIGEIRSLGFPDYTIYPAGDRSEYAPIIYIEPFDDYNQRALGFDLFSEPARRTALLRARDSGLPALTGKITLVQETGPNPPAGFLLVIPVYKNSEPHETVAERRASILGYITAPFLVNDFIESTLLGFDQNIVFALFDANIDQKSTTNDAGLMYVSDQGKFSLDGSYSSRFSRTVTIAAIDYPWAASFVDTPDYASHDPQDSLPIVVLGFGFLLSGALSFLVYSLATGRSRALAYAERATRDLQLEEMKLTQEKTKDEAIIASIGDGFFAVDREGKIIMINQQAESMFGFIANEVVGKKYSEVFEVQDANGVIVPLSERPMERALSEKKKVTTTTTTTTTYWYVRKNKTKFPVALTVTPIILDGEVIGGIDIFRDISKEKEVDRAKSEFVSIASHQLKTPPTAIKLLTERLLGGKMGRLTEKQKEYINDVHSSNQRSIEIVNALLNVSRIEMGTFTIQLNEKNICTVVQSILSELQSIIDKKQLKLEEIYQEKDIPLLIDEGLFRMVLSNLVMNAVNYTAEGGTLHVECRQVDKGQIIGEKFLGESSFVVIVSDTGYGIPKQQQDKLFTKFFRADNAREKHPDGTGLGLYIVKSILDNSGGSIWFTSEENKGTHFYVAIPMTGMKAKVGKKELVEI